MARLASQMDELSPWVLLQLEVLVDTMMLPLLWERMVWPGGHPEHSVHRHCGISGMAGASPTPGAVILTPSRHQASSAGPQRRTGFHRDMPPACGKLGGELAKDRDIQRSLRRD